MITLWMLYCLGVTALLTVAAAACEYVLRGRGVPLRGVWACAIVASLLLPAWSLATSIRSIDAASAEPVTRTSVAPSISLNAPAPLVSTPAVNTPVRIPSIPRTLAPARDVLNAASPGVLVAWLVSSLWMSVFLLGGWLRIRGQRSRWRRVRIGEREVMISDGTGPAVVGFVHPGIVLPEWIFQLEQNRRRLVLLHEEEHLRAHDERLLFLASIALIVMPYNFALWYQVRRLRLAVEIDCDARVLRVHPD